MILRINEYIKCEEKRKKVRLISIIDDKILVANYSGYYMLPGGKIENDEEEIDALKREVYEETGNIINDLFPFVTTLNYAKDYQSRDGNKKKNRLIETTYLKTNDSIDLTKSPQLSENEKKGNFRLRYIKLSELIDILEKDAITPKQKIFANELLKVIKYYLKNEQLIDLHTHTYYSDGQYSPNEVIKKAIDKNIKTIAITDHDTVLGLKEIDFKQFPNIEIIPGIELTVKRPFGRMHILGFNIDYNNPILLNTLKSIKDNNINNLRNIVRYLEEKKIIFPKEDIEEIFNRIGNIGRPDIAKLLIKYGYVETVQQAFDEYLIEAFNKTRKDTQGYTYKDILKLILTANGIPILAHPNSLELNNEDFENLLLDMINCGLKGLEIEHPNLTEEERKFYMSMVEKYNLAFSVGSDYHGEKVKPNIELGTGNNNIYATDASVLKLIRKNTH